jgi:hypothetical protein
VNRATAIPANPRRRIGDAGISYVGILVIKIHLE